MHFRDYLHDIPLKSLKYIAEGLNVSVEYNARIKLVNAIDRAFWDSTLTENILESLDHDNKTTLSMIAFSFDSGVNEKSLLKKLEKTIGNVQQCLRENVDNLMRKGLVGGVDPENPVYFSPGGPAEQIRKYFSREFVEKNSKIKSSGHNELLEDIFSLLALIYKENLPLTLSGKAKKAILERAFLSDISVEKSKEGFTEELRNSFITDYLIEREIVGENLKELRATAQISGWLALSSTQRLQDIVSFALTYFLSDYISFIPVSGILCELESGESFTVRKLAYFLHSRTLAQGGFAKIQIKLTGLMSVLCGLGLFYHDKDIYSLTAMGSAFFRNEKLQMDENCSEQFITQPNFEIIAGPEIDPKIRFRLELMTSRIGRDMVQTYQITREGIIRARERGMSTEDVMKFFMGHSKNPLPQNVSFSIEAWCGDYGSIYFEDALLMRFKDDAVCESVMHIPEIACCVKEKLSETVIAIKREYASIATNALKKAGFHPELYGGPLNDPSLSGTVYIPSSISKIQESEMLPETNGKFIFPGFTVVPECP